MLLRRLGQHSSPAQVATSAVLHASRFTIENLPIQWRGEVRLDDQPADARAILTAFGEAMRAEVLESYGAHFPTDTR